MPTLFSYILQASGCMGIFYLLYISLFRKETFYRFNRLLLLSAFLFSGLLPLLPLPAVSRWKSVPTDNNNPPAAIFFNSNVAAPTIQQPAPVTTSWWENGAKYAVAIYLMVALLLLLLHLWQLWKIRQLIKAGDVIPENNVRYVHLNGFKTPFSFLHFIFLDTNAYEQTELQAVLCHEQAHVKQLHTIDNLLASFYCCLMWINPAAWLCKRALQLNLEYLADNAVMQQNINRDQYQYSLLKIGLQQHANTLANHFSKSFIKNRILMMNKTQSPPKRSWKYLLVIPVLAAAAGLVSAAKPATIDAKEGRKYIVVNQQGIFGTVTQHTSDEDFAVMTKLLKENGYVLTVPTLKRNAAGEISAINLKIERPSKSSVAQNEENENGIAPFFFTLVPAESYGGIGQYPMKKFFPASLVSVAIQESDGPIKGVITDSSYLSRFPGGEEAFRKYIARHIRYPRASLENETVGLVTTQYQIEPDGSITNVEKLSGPKDLGDEVIRVIKEMPSFAPDPAGKTVRTVLRAGFSIDNEKTFTEKFGKDEADVIIIGYGPKR